MKRLFQIILLVQAIILSALLTGSMDAFVRISILMTSLWE